MPRFGIFLEVGAKAGSFALWCGSAISTQRHPWLPHALCSLIQKFAQLSLPEPSVLGRVQALVLVNYLLISYQSHAAKVLDVQSMNANSLYYVSI